MTKYEDVERLRSDWLRLFEASRVQNPFAHPEWVLAWARHFVRPDDLYVLAVRSGGELVGVAPFYRRTFGRFGPRIVALRTLGDDRYSQLTEMSYVLAAREHSRRVLRAVVGYLCEHADEWDWAEVALGPSQGWLEREWIPRRGTGSGCVAMHKGTRAFVVLPLAASWDELRGRLKRNVKESIRRGANRLGREGHEWRLVEPNGTAEELDRSLGTLVDLHRARAQVQGKEPHPDYFEDRRVEEFLYDVAHRLQPSGGLSSLALEVDGETVAARLVLETRDSVFFSVSGFDPIWWRYNVATTLFSLALQRAIGRGQTLANLSQGPDVSKLRWSEQIEYAQSFTLVGDRLRSRVAVSAFWHMRAEYLSQLSGRPAGDHGETDETAELPEERRDSRVPTAWILN